MSHQWWIQLMSDTIGNRPLVSHLLLVLGYHLPLGTPNFPSHLTILVLKPTVLGFPILRTPQKNMRKRDNYGHMQHSFPWVSLGFSNNRRTTLDPIDVRVNKESEI